MALVFCDGFSHYATADLASRGWAIISGSPTINSANGRFGNGCLTVVQNSTISRSFGTNVSTLMVQFGFLRDATSGSTYTLMDFRDSGSLQVDVRLINNEFITIRSNGGGTIVFTAASALNEDQYYYFEIKIVFHATTGAITLKQNGATLYAGTSLDTLGTANAYCNEIRMASPNASGGMRYSDLVVMDTTGSFMNDLIGDKKITTIFPDGAGNYTDFTPLSGANYTNVDEAAPDGDTTYVESSTVAHKDTYAMGPTTGLTSISAVVVNTFAKKTDAGAREIRHRVRSNSVDANGGTLALSSNYTSSQSPFYQNPDGNVDWTNTTVSAVEAGMEVVT